MKRPRESKCSTRNGSRFRHHPYSGRGHVRIPGHRDLSFAKTRTYWRERTYEGRSKRTLGLLMGGLVLSLAVHVCLSCGANANFLVEVYDWKAHRIFFAGG